MGLIKFVHVDERNDEQALDLAYLSRSRHVDLFSDVHVDVMGDSQLADDIRQIAMEPVVIC